MYATIPVCTVLSRRVAIYPLRRFSSAYQTMIGMRRGLWGTVLRQNQTVSRDTLNFSQFRQDSELEQAVVTSSTSTVRTNPMPAAEETVVPPSKRSKLDTDMPTNAIEEQTPAQPRLRFVKLSKEAKAPSKGSVTAAGFDLYSAYDYTIPPLGKEKILTDIAIELPEGCYGRVAPRSGLAWNHQIDVGAGVIDRDYRGNIGVILFNLGPKEFEVKKDMRIAQLICEKICYPEIQEVTELGKTERGSGGYGSTGIN